MVRKTKAEALETRNLLLDSAERLFYENGVSKTSLTDIASAANLTRGAIYWHFKNKFDLLQALMERVRLPPESLMEANPEENPLQALREYAVRMLRETATNPRRKRILAILFHRCEANDEAKALIVRQQAAYLECTKHIHCCLTAAVKMNQLPQNLNQEKATTALLALLFGLINNWLFFPDSFNLELDAPDLIDSYFAMLTSSTTLLNA